MQCDWPMAHSAPDDSPLKGKLEVLRRPERKLLSMNPRPLRNVMSLQAPDKEVIPYRPHHLRHERDIQRFHAIDPERIDILRIIRPRHRRARSRSKPRVALAARDLVPQQMERSVRLHQSKRILLSDRTYRNRGLRTRVDDLVKQRYLARQRNRVSRGRRSMLVLAPHIQRKRPPLLHRRSTGNRIETRLVRPPVIIV